MVSGVRVARLAGVLGVGVGGVFVKPLPDCFPLCCRPSFFPRTKLMVG